MLPLLAIGGKVTDDLYKKGQKAFEIGDYPQMLEYCLQALYLTENSDCKTRAYANIKVSHAYYYLQQHETCIQYLNQAKNISNQCNDSLYTVALRQLGTLYLETRKLDSAKHYLFASEKLLYASENWKELSTLYAILGEFLGDKADKNYLDLAETYALKAKDTVAWAYASVKIGSYAAEHNNCAKANKYVQQGLELYRKKNLVEGEMFALAVLARVYGRCGSAWETYLTFHKYDKIRDSIFRKETAVKTAHYRTLYDTERKDRENAELIKDRKLLLAGFIIVVLSLSIGFTFFIARYKIKKQKEVDKKLAEEKQQHFEAVIEAEEKERKRIASDLHDGVGQTMSAAKINLSILQREIPFTNQDQVNAFEKIVALVDESCREVRSVSHSMMPNTLLRSGLATAIRSFINQIDSRVLKVDLYFEGLQQSLETNKEVILYRVIQECVNNVTKHAHATRLTISIIKDKEGISVTVEDNGKGFLVAAIPTSSGIGLENIRSRITYLNGSVEWDSAPGKGTVVMINLPS